jgi:DnaJ-class molecular chaperone
VASKQADNDGQTDEEAHEPRECMPCRGSGKLISNLGGGPSEVTCPWCEGGGVRIAGIDAQARWGDEAAGAAPAASDERGSASA